MSGEQASPRCVVCGDLGESFLARDDLQLVRSATCGLEWQHPMPSSAELDALYDASYFERWGNVDDSEENAVREMKRATYGVVLEAVRLHTNGATLLDVGCALGYLVESALDSGFDARGLDRNEHAIRAASARLGDRVHAGELDASAFPGLRFDVITLTDVLEHVPDPGALLEQCRVRLGDSGVLVLLLPNAASLTRRLFGLRWPHYVPEHLYHFAPENLRSLLASHGFDVFETRTAFRKAFTGHYLASYASRLGSFTPPGLNHLARLGRLPLRLPTGEMLIIARPKRPSR